MIDEIFADIMKEARSRKGKDLIKNLYAVSMEIGQRLFAAMEGIRSQEREDKFNER